MSNIRSGDIRLNRNQRKNGLTTPRASVNADKTGEGLAQRSKECASAIKINLPDGEIAVADLLPLIPENRLYRLFYHRGLPGLGLRVTRKGVAAFVLSYRLAGRKRSVTIGRFPETNLQRAEQLARGYFAKSQRGRLPSMRTLANEYVHRHASVYKRRSSAAGDVAMLNHGVLPRVGSLAVAAVGRRDIENIQRSLLHTPVRANRVLALLSKMFSLAMLWDWVPKNPVKGVPRFPEQKRERWLRPEELGRLLRVLESTGKSPKTYAGTNALRLILLTGCRKGEMLAARWEDFDLKRQVWIKPAHYTKQKRVEHIPLSSAAVQLLSSMLKAATCGLSRAGPVPGKSGQRLFPSLNVAKLRKFWARIRAQINIPDVRIHDLRHTFASMLVSAGESLPTVGKLLGHTQIRTTERYAHLADKPQRQAVERFGRIYSDAGPR